MPACTPLVTERDRHLVGGDVGPQVGEHRRGSPRRAASDTALERPARRRPMTAMLNRSSALGRRAGGRCAMSSSRSTPHSVGPARRSSVSISSRGNRSMPAGHGRVGGEDARRPGRPRRASAKVRPSVDDAPGGCARGPRKPAWPSLVWNTWASMPSASSAADAADAEQDLLAQAVLDVAAVEPVGDLRGGRRGSRRRRRRAGRAGCGRRRPATPGPRAAAPARSTVDPDAVAAGQRHGVRVEVGVALLLPAVGRSEAWRK